jgi:hypothetical protein
LRTDQLERLKKLGKLLSELIQETGNIEELEPMFIFELWVSEWKRELEIKKFYNEN